MRPAGFLHPPAIFADGVTTLAGGNGTARTPPSSRFGAANPTGDSLPPPFGFAPPGRVSGSASGYSGQCVTPATSREWPLPHIDSGSTDAGSRTPGGAENRTRLLRLAKMAKSGVSPGFSIILSSCGIGFRAFQSQIRALFPGERLKIEPFGRDLDAWKGFLEGLLLLRRVRVLL